MITYQYKCGVCQLEFETQQSIKDKPLKKCHICNQYALERVITGGLTPICNNVTTLGSYADKAHKKMGHYEKEEKRHDYKEARKLARKQLRKEAEIKLGRPLMDIETKPELVEKNRKISNMTPEQKDIYIKTGKGL